MTKVRTKLLALGARALRSPLAHDSAAALLLRIAWAVTAVLAQVVAARVLGAAGFGVYTYVIAWLSVLSLLATIGFENTLLRFATSYRARGELGLLAGLERYTERRVLAAGLLIVMLSWGMLAVLGERLLPTVAWTMAVGLLMIPIMALASLRVALLRALGHLVAALAYADLLRHGLVLMALAAASIALPGWLGPMQAIALTLLATVLSLLLLSSVLRRVRPSTVRIAERRTEWRRTALPFLFLAGSQIIITQTDVLMLGWLLDTTEAGVYAAAVRLADLAVFPVAAINLAAAPAVAAAHALGDRAQLQRMATWAAHVGLAAAVIAALPLGLFPGWFLGFFGAAFTPGAGVLQTLLIAKLITASTGILGHLLAMTGLERQLAVILALAAVGNVALNAVLISALGVVGAAYATVVTTVSYIGVAAVVVWIRLRIIPGPIAFLARRRGF